MKLQTRIAIVSVIVLGAWLSQRVLYAFLDPADALPPGQLQTKLENFPQKIGNWEGEDRPIDDETMQSYPDDSLHRTYQIPQTHHQVMLWMAYSKAGKDRDHHPEVCYAVQGLPEDPDFRKTIDVPGHEVPVQQFRFGYKGNYQLVYYWHYQLPAEDSSELSEFQSLYREMRHRPASITIEVFSADPTGNGSETVVEFVNLVDAELQKILGPGAVRGSDRREVKILNQGH